MWFNFGISETILIKTKSPLPGDGIPSTKMIFVIISTFDSLSNLIIIIIICCNQLFYYFTRLRII